jgi:AcrR family transcriptional regulator
MSYKQKQQEQKRELILEEATRLFIEDGYENMKISDLAKNSGVSIGVIYGLFGSKEGLYNQYVMNQIEYFIDLIQKELLHQTNPVEMLKIITKIHFSAIIKNKNALKESIVSDPTFFLNISADDENPLMNLYTYITRNVIEPLLKEMGSEKNPFELFFLYDGIVLGMIKYWIITGGDIMERVDEAIDTFVLIIKKS